MNLELLRPFEKEAAKRGESIYHFVDSRVEPVTFIAEAGPDGDHALRDSDGNCMFTSNDFLRMRPLAWVKEKPLYKGDVLYSADSGDPRTVTHVMAGINDTLVYFTESEGYVYAESCTWTKPEPKKTTRTVKFLGLMTQLGALVLVSEDSHLRECVWSESKRVPGADVTYEVEE